MVNLHRRSVRTHGLLSLGAGALLATAALALAATAPPGPPGLDQTPPLDLSSQQSVPLDHGVSEYPGVTYASVRGFRPLTLDLYLPARTSSSLRPAVVWIHGGGWMGGSARAGVPLFGSGPKMLSALAARGYVVAGTTYRLSGEAKFPAAIEDVKASIRWLRLNATALGLDSNRIGVWGESAGGQLASLAGTACDVPELEGTANSPGKVSSCVQAVVDWYGPSDFALMDAQALPGAANHGAATSAESNYVGCAVAQCPKETLKAASPISYIKTGAPPFLIFHGDADTAVPPKQSQELYDALRAHGVAAQLHYIAGANHLFMGASAADAERIMTQVEQFFDRTLAAKR